MEQEFLGSVVYEDTFQNFVSELEPRFDKAILVDVNVNNYAGISSVDFVFKLENIGKHEHPNLIGSLVQSLHYQPLLLNKIGFKKDDKFSFGSIYLDDEDKLILNTALLKKEGN
ncbi:hypothetical protein G6R29_06070 [Fructobacillus sp. M2-14]|uniref:Uncharacterized protein n=1 Tax=Fructobacillus broussonetiae TaxID=2713173 RepID=A0ABS5R160_9LACO|nr:hypothetical protein [Fructobacillus broussonetiae]MBS9339184.1 hypothetical protein [Fructobacillus broussonetiae]